MEDLSLSRSSSDINVGIDALSDASGPIISSGNPTHCYSWLSRITTVTLDLCGSDLAQRIELSCPNGPTFRTEIQKRKDDKGDEMQDQKQFILMNSRNEKLLTVDYSNDRQSFHIMEPDSESFIAFFTINDEGALSLENSNVDIHNVIDGETYKASPADTPCRLSIKPEKGEEMAIIARPPAKWTQFQNGTVTLNFTGDEREGLTTREKAIVLGFLIAVGIFGLDYWKRSTSGLFTFYVMSIMVLAILVIFIFYKTRESHVATTPKGPLRAVSLFLSDDGNGTHNQFNAL